MFENLQSVSPSWAEVFGQGRALRFGGLLSIIALHAGGNYMVVTLAPSIVSQIGGGSLIGALTALFNISAILAAAAVGPLMSKCSASRLMWVMAGLSLIGAVMSGLALDMQFVALGRGLAGFGGGGLLALAFIALRAESTISAWPKVSSLSGVFWIGAAFAGPLLGGILADTIGWRLAFIILGIATLAYALANSGIIRTTKSNGTYDGFPIVSFTAFGCGVVFISFAPLVESPILLVCVGTIGLGLLFFAALRERNRAPRMFPRNAFRLRTSQGQALCAKLTLGASAMSILVFGPLLLTSVHGTSATFAGSFVLIETLSWSIASFIVVSVAPKLTQRLTAFGPVLSVAGLCGCAIFLVSGMLPLAALSIAMCGAGLGLAWPLLGQIIVANEGEIDPTGGETTKTMAMVSSAESLGFSIGGAIVGLAGSTAAGGNVETVDQIHIAATVGISTSIPIAIVGGLICFIVVKRAPKF